MEGVSVAELCRKGKGGEGKGVGKGKGSFSGHEASALPRYATQQTDTGILTPSKALSQISQGLNPSYTPSPTREEPQGERAGKLSDPPGMLDHPQCWSPSGSSSLPCTRRSLMKRRAQCSQTPSNPNAATDTEPWRSVRVTEGGCAGRQVLVTRQRLEVTRGLGEPKRPNRLEVGCGCGLPAGLSELGAAGEDESDPKTPSTGDTSKPASRASCNGLRWLLDWPPRGSHRSPVGDGPLPVARWSGAVLLGQGPGAGVAQLLILRAADVPCHHAPLSAPG